MSVSSTNSSLCYDDQSSTTVTQSKSYEVLKENEQFDKYSNKIKQNFWVCTKSSVTQQHKISLSISSIYSKCPCSILSYSWQHETLLSFCSRVKGPHTMLSCISVREWDRERERHGVGGRTRCAMWSWQAVWEMKRETTQWQCSAIERDHSHFAQNTPLVWACLQPCSQCCAHRSFRQHKRQKYANRRSLKDKTDEREWMRLSGAGLSSPHCKCSFPFCHVDSGHLYHRDMSDNHHHLWLAASPAQLATSVGNWPQS